MQNILCLLYPKFAGLRNRIRLKNRGTIAKLVLLLLLGLLFWSGIFAIFYRVLLYLKGTEGFGDALAAKLLSMVFLTFFSILIFSNIITALSAFFASEELQLIIASPFELTNLYYTKFFETIINSSWMVVLFSLPVFLSYGIAYKQIFFYYLVIIAVMTPFIIICGVLGICFAMSLTMLFPARRVRDVMVLLSLFLGIALYCLFRFLQPEKLVDPDAFRTLVEYFSAIEAPTSPFLPSQWATDTVASFILNVKEGFMFNLLLLWSTALALAVIINEFFKKVYFTAWTKSQEAQSTRLKKYRIFKTLLRAILSRFDSATRELVIKDLCCFFRDSAQWSQLFILSAIIVIYLYNFSVLPLEKSPFSTIYLQNLISFLNLGLAGFTISAVAVRFAFPAISIEGDSFWIIKSSPLELRRFVWCKFWMNFTLLLVLAEGLTVCSNYLLRVDRYMMLISTITIALMTFGITSLSIGCGAFYPRFDIENKAQIPTGFGGLMYMMLAILFIGSIIVIEAWPVYIVLMAQLKKTVLTDLQWLEIIGLFCTVLIINSAVFYLPMKVGIKKLSGLENF